ncbi:hypothetical protein SDC9_148846 [bioreactor metagenome]|uniref:Uncharacterized protein n=1 Tax=bioreactor metagenome TaxID=1076179 RepID=A0A645EJL0_9ZZZZ
MAIVERGSPRGVSAAPRPIEKHAMIVRSILDFRDKGIALTTSTRIIAARIADRILEDKPSTTIRRKPKTLTESISVSFLIALWIGECHL